MDISYLSVDWIVLYVYLSPSKQKLSYILKVLNCWNFLFELIVFYLACFSLVIAFILIQLVFISFLFLFPYIKLSLLTAWNRGVLSGNIFLL